jgi:hypothetical protein
MREAVDGTTFDYTVQPASYLRALHELQQFSPADFSKRVRIDLDYAAAMTAPANWRGKVVRYRGLLMFTRADKLHDAEIAGISDVYRAVIAATDGSDGVLIDLPEPISGVEARRDIVDVEGVFYETVSFENQKGKKTLIPYLLCRSVKVVDPKTLKKSFDSAPNAFGIAIIAMALMWFFYRLFTLKSRPVVTGIRLRDRATLARIRPMSPTPPPADRAPGSQGPPAVPPGTSG